MSTIWALWEAVVASTICDFCYSDRDSFATVTVQMGMGNPCQGLYGGTGSRHYGREAGLFHFSSAYLPCHAHGTDLFPGYCRYGLSSCKPGTHGGLGAEHDAERTADRAPGTSASGADLAIIEPSLDRIPGALRAWCGADVCWLNSGVIHKQ